MAERGRPYHPEGNVIPPERGGNRLDVTTNPRRPETRTPTIPGETPPPPDKALDPLAQPPTKEEADSANTLQPSGTERLLTGETKHVYPTNANLISIPDPSSGDDKVVVVNR